jgi:outer membrane autotransporter protein
MFFRSLARASTLFSAFVAALFMFLTTAAHATVPVWTGAPIAAQFVNNNVIINLKDQGVLRGGPTINVSVDAIFVDGQPSASVSVVNAFQGGICLGIGDQGFEGTTVTVRLTATNGLDQSATQEVDIVRQDGGSVDPENSQQVTACFDQNSPPVADAGPDQTVNQGATVTLDGSGSSDADADTVLTYTWFDLNEDRTLGQSTTPQLQVVLAPGVHDIELSVTDDSGDGETGFALDNVQITVNNAVLPSASAGLDQTVNDTDGLSGEVVTLNGSASTDPDGTIAEYQWGLQIDPETIQPLGTGATITVRLADGINDVRLQVTDNAGNDSTDDVVITINAPAVPTANAGPDRNVADSDGQAGERVTLDASASTDPDDAIASYEWLRVVDVEQSESLGFGQQLTVTLPDGDNTIILVVTDNSENTSTDTVVITVAEPSPEVTLSEIPNLTPNQRRMANKLDGMCDALAQREADEVSLSVDQVDLLAKCRGIRTALNSTANQIEAIEELTPEDFAVARTQTLLFANTQYASIMDRLMALRGGAKGLSLAGLNVIVDGKLVPLAQLEDMAKKLLGGGASADGSAADEPGGLLSDKWGLWFRGNFSFGEKESTVSSPAFDADQWAFVAGTDYRISDKAVFGVALSYGSSSVDFDLDDGALDTDSLSISLYGSAYAAKNFYFDGIFNYSNSSYDASRNITYVDGTGLINEDAAGDTDGQTLSGGLSMGYDFLAGGLTISPNLGFFYIDTTIDGFTETGAGGLNLIYDEQAFKSLTGNAGLRLTYAWNVSWGVLLPHLRVDYVREFEDDVDVFGVRFANDPNAASTPPILVETENPDNSYWRLAGGFSAQFKHGISGYIEYQRLEGFESINFQDVSIGLRFQRSF